jgi:hypothetical protein
MGIGLQLKKCAFRAEPAAAFMPVRVQRNTGLTIFDGDAVVQPSALLDLFCVRHR